MIRNWWLGYKFRGSSCFILAFELKALKMGLEACNWEVFGNVSTKKLKAFNKIVFWGAKEMEAPLVEAKRVAI